VDERKTYNGRNAGLAIVGTVVVVFVLLNLLGLKARHERPLPTPTVVTVSPS
jgi:hypothetical protein